jgi:peptide/nickel transport system substrate-binding protein
MEGFKMSLINSINRRNFLITSGSLAGLSVLPWMSPNAAFGADQTLTLALPNNPANFDPAHQANHDTMACSQVVFENLLEVDTDGNIQPMLAKSWSVSEDGLTYLFDLRDDVYFHNGQKMTAEDVKYSYDTVRNKKYKLRRRSLWTPIKEVVIESPTKIRFDMEFPYNDLPKLMTKYMGVWPKGSREPGQPGDAAGENAIKKGPVGLGTGPGIFVKFVSNDYVEFKRNPNYWRKDLPKWNKLIFKVVPEDAVRVAYLLTNQAQVITAPPPREFVRLKDFKGISGASKPSYGFMMLTMNLAAAPMDDVNFRFAVSRAINREEIAQLFGGVFTPHAVFTFAGNAPGRPFNLEAERALDFNLDSAKEYLAKSKYPNGTDFELVIPAVPYIVNVSEAALLLQGQLAKIGIKVRIQTLQMRSYFKKAFGKDKTNNMHVFMNPPSTTYGLAGQFFSGRKIQLAKNFEKLYPETSKEFDEATRKAWASKTSAEAEVHVEKMQGLIARECTGIAIGNVSAANLWRSDVKGFDVNTCVTMRTRNLSL